MDESKDSWAKPFSATEPPYRDRNSARMSELCVDLRTVTLVLGCVHGGVTRNQERSRCDAIFSLYRRTDARRTFQIQIDAAPPAQSDDLVSRQSKCTDLTV